MARGVAKKGMRPKRRFGSRTKNLARYKMAEDAQIEYKNVTLLQKYLTDRGKIVSRRVSGVTAKQQRQLTSAIKQARFLALLPSGSAR